MPMYVRRGMLSMRALSAPIPSLRSRQSVVVRCFLTSGASALRSTFSLVILSIRRQYSGLRLPSSKFKKSILLNILVEYYSLRNRWSRRWNREAAVPSRSSSIDGRRRNFGWLQLTWCMIIANIHTYGHDQYFPSNTAEGPSRCTH